MEHVLAQHIITRAAEDMASTIVDSNSHDTDHNFQSPLKSIFKSLPETKSEIKYYCWSQFHHKCQYWGNRLQSPHQVYEYSKVLDCESYRVYFRGRTTGELFSFWWWPQNIHVQHGWTSPGGSGLIWWYGLWYRRLTCYPSCKKVLKPRQSSMQYCPTGDLLSWTQK